MGERKLQGGGRQRNVHALTYLFDANSTLELRGRHTSRGVTLIAFGADGQDPEAKWGPDDDAHALLGAAVELGPGGLLVEQTVRPRNEEQVELEEIQELGDHARDIHPRPDGTDRPVGAELVQCLEPARYQL